ncbi:MAG: DUF192 domain-containing protein [Clostridia bacterium]|nr:DUF192 domain-containing protein [Clostridia bacterium]
MIYKLYHKNHVLIDEIQIADTFMKRLRGFMFYKKPPVKALGIKPCNSIHTFFMKFNIDVLFLDQDMVVIEKLTGLKKNKMIMPIKNSKYVIESHENAFDNVSVGDVMSIC